MIPALRTEYRKLVTTRLWWGLLLCLAVYMAFLGAVMAFGLADAGAAAFGTPGGDGSEAPPLAPLDVALTVYTLAPTLGYVFPVIVGAMAVTGEYRHMTVTPTFLAEPRRTTVLGAKMISSFPVGLAFGLVGTLATVGAGAAVLAMMGEPSLLTDPEVLRTIALSVLVLAVWAMVGVGFGTVLTHQVAAIVTLLAFTQFVEPVLRILLGLFEPTAGAAKWLPGAAGEAVTGTSLYSTGGLSDLLPWWQGLLVLLGYALLLAAVGRVTTLRRDVT